MSTIFNEQTIRTINGSLGRFSIWVHDSGIKNNVSLSVRIKFGEEEFTAKELSKDDLQRFFDLVDEVKEESYKLLDNK